MLIFVYLKYYSFNGGKNVKLYVCIFSSDVVWEEENIVLGGLEFCQFLFGKPVRSEIIDCYMKIMKKQSIKQGFEIFCMDTGVQVYFHLLIDIFKFYLKF